MLRVMCLGDVVGRPGRQLLLQKAEVLRSQYKLDLLIVNGENASGGTGLDAKNAAEFNAAGVDVITLGDHAWKRKGIFKYLEDNPDRCIRPANFASATKGGPTGRGYAIWKHPSGQTVGVINVMGRVYFDIALDCPFKTIDRLLTNQLKDCAVVICDLHAEASSEKIAMGKYLDGRASLVVGTHTHVQTADEQILPGGTGYISDLGMSGPMGGVIGMSKDIALGRFLSGVPGNYEVADLSLIHISEPTRPC